MYSPPDFAKYLRSLTWWLHAVNLGWTQRDLTTLLSLMRPGDEIAAVSISVIDVTSHSTVIVSGVDRNGVTRVHEIARSVDRKFYANVVPDSKIDSMDYEQRVAVGPVREPTIWLELCECRDFKRHEYTCELYHRKFEPEVAAAPIVEPEAEPAVAAEKPKKRDKKAPLPGQTKMF
jgi:hypothetical protein